MFRLWRSLRRRVLARRPLPEEWREIAERHFPFARRVEAAERERFLVRLNVFAREKRFEGAGGLAVTDEMRVTVAGAAARLARNLPLDVYDDVVTVLLYEGAWRAPGGEGAHLGEAHGWGLVVLAWDSVRQGLANPYDGRETALHELAHMLDVADGGFDGTPELREWGDYRAWARVFSERFAALRRRPHGNVLRAYGARNEAEFFAVATEAFFEKPAQLRRKAPQLYEELRRYYGLEPTPNAPRAA